MAGEADLSRLWQLNASLPEPCSTCLHDGIAHIAQTRPTAPAIDAWDGRLTYRQLEELTLQYAALLHSQVDVGPGQIVPLLFEKSRCTSAAVLAVLRRGAAFVLLDHTLSDSRLESIVRQVNAKVILCAPQLHHHAARLLPMVVALPTPDSLPLEVPPTTTSLSSIPVDASQTACVVFTSGSTGTPKGIPLSHENLASTFRHTAPTVGLDSHSRVYEFSSYGFDAVLYQSLGTLSQGGCVCIPKHSDRQERLAESMCELKTNLAILTPSVARLLEPSTVPSLKTLKLVGEPASQDVIDRWSSSVTIVMGYGPSECAINSNATAFDPTSMPVNNIGPGLSCRCWVVDPVNPNVLLPWGECGELLLEGPAVSKGYLNDEQRTSQSFIPPPPWLLRGHQGRSGRSSVLYKTGDLVRYAHDGSILCHGRKDQQRKHRGQRIELDEIQHCIRAQAPGCTVCVELCELAWATEEPQLVAFYVPSSDPHRRPENSSSTMADLFLSPDEAAELTTASLRQALQSELPSYMIPSLVLPLKLMPRTKPSDKEDRKALQDAARGLTQIQLRRYSGMSSRLESPVEALATENELALQRLWRTILDLTFDPQPSDNFYSLGGNSLSAMRLISAAAEESQCLSMQDILEHENLKDLAARLKASTPAIAASCHPAAFSLIHGNTPMSHLVEEMSQICDCAPDEIEDAFPCTPLQEGLVALSQLKRGANIASRVFNVEASADLDRLARAWAHVSEKNPIMRTTIVSTGRNGLLQVVLRSLLRVKESDVSMRQATVPEDFTPGSPFTEVTLYRAYGETGPQVHWRAHHAVCDAWMADRIFEEVEDAYCGHPVPTAVPFCLLTDYVAHLDPGEYEPFWSQALGSPCPAIFPSPAQNDAAQSWADQSMQYNVPLERPVSAMRAPLSQYIQLAWALVCSKYTESPDVVYGLVISGRNAPVAGIEHMTGPTIATVPFRTKLVMTASVRTSLKHIQQQIAAGIAYEQTGLQRIRRISADTASACNFQSLLVVQRQEHVKAGRIQDPVKHISNERLAFSNYPLTMECTMADDSSNVQVDAQFNSSTICPTSMEHIIHQFCHCLSQLVLQPTATLQSISLFSDFDHKQVQAWNSSEPRPVRRTLHSYVETRAQSHPQAQAICAWDGDLTYAEVERYSSELAESLAGYGIDVSDVVPMCTEKSRWSPVMMIAILKLGASCVLLDAAQPIARIASIVESINPKVILVSEAREVALSPLNVRLHKIQNPSLGGGQLHQNALLQRQVSPDTIAFIVFTSGSSGSPKGVMLSHQALSTSIMAHGPQLGVQDTSRMLQFASCSFDIHIYEQMTTLVLGGCVCIPSENERMNDPAQFAIRSQATITITAPTILKAFGNISVPSFKAISLGGEGISQDIVDEWGKSAKLFNGYGPAECTICAMHPIDTYRNPLATIGRGLGCHFWIADCENPEKLAPIGVVGELLLEGPVLASGYWNDPEKTGQAFVKGLAWRKGLCRNATSPVYKSGDLVKYNPDGTVLFIGRKDTQVKLRGMRIELGEIEFHLQRTFSRRRVVAEVCSFANSSNAHVVAFVEPESRSTLCADRDLEQLEGTQERRDENEQAQSILAQSLPSHMVPSIIIHLNRIPETASGKTDRKKLRAAVATLHYEDSLRVWLPRASSEPSAAAKSRQISGPTEVKLRHAWSSVLEVPEDSILAEDSFFSKGGDSIAAMRLVAALRKLQVPMSVSDIFSRPELYRMAELCDEVQHSIKAPELGPKEPFQLLAADDCEAFLSRHVTSQYAIPRASIVDLLPATSLQSFALANCATFFMFRMPREILLEHVLHAWEQLVAQHDILRTVFIQAGEQYYQVVLDQLQVPVQSYSTHISTAAQLEEVLRNQECAATPIPLSATPLKLITMEGYGCRWLVLRILHAQYDGFSIAELWGDWSRAYAGQSLGPRCSYGDFVYLSNQLGTSGGHDYWRKLLQDSEMTFIKHPSLACQAADSPATIESSCTLEAPQQLPEDILMATFVQAVWIVTLAKWTGKTDIVFGLVTSGRRSSRHAFDTVMGPCLEIMPVRMQVQRGWTMRELCTRVQQQGRVSVEFEGMELHEIIEQCTDWDGDLPLGSWLQHDNTDWNAHLRFGEHDLGAPHVLDVPYSQDDVGLETMALDGRLHVKTSAPDNLVGHADVVKLRDMVCSNVLEFAGNMDQAIL